jgi:hypothetical protein
VRVRGEYPSLDVVLESSRRDQQQVVFPSSGSYITSSSIPLSPQSRYYGSNFQFLPTLSQYATNQDYNNARSTRPTHDSTASPFRHSDSHAVFTAISDPNRPRRVSNKLRKPARHVKAKAVPIPATEPPVFAKFPDFTPDPPVPTKPLRSPSPRQRQRKQSMFSRVFSFRRRKSITSAAHKAETGYTTEPLQLPPAYQRKLALSVGEEVESECEEYGTEEDGEEWRGSWWSEEGHGYRQCACFCLFVFLLGRARADFDFVFILPRFVDDTTR